jgi:hypothetical protein
LLGGEGALVVLLDLVVGLDVRRLGQGHDRLVVVLGGMALGVGLAEALDGEAGAFLGRKGGEPIAVGGGVFGIARVLEIGGGETGT